MDRRISILHRRKIKCPFWNRYPDQQERCSTNLTRHAYHPAYATGSGTVSDRIEPVSQKCDRPAEKPLDSTHNGSLVKVLVNRTQNQTKCPKLSRFYGITIRMFYGDHPPPHFHAVYQGDEIQVNIETLEVIRGQMSRRALSLVLEWAALHREELRQAWLLASQNRAPDKIAPLE